jgi:hypothetical protein
VFSIFLCIQHSLTDNTHFTNIPVTDSQAGVTTASKPALGPTQPPIQWVPEALIRKIKRPRREADYSPPRNAEVKMRGAIPSLPQYVFMAWCLVKHRDNFNVYCAFIIDRNRAKIGTGVAHWYRVGLRQGLGNFLFATASRLDLGPTRPPIQWVPAALSLGVKRPGREADHSPSSAEVKNAWNHTSTPPMYLNGVLHS